MLPSALQTQWKQECCIVAPKAGSGQSCGAPTVTTGTCTGGAVKDDAGTCATDTCSAADFGGANMACCKLPPQRCAMGSGVCTDGAVKDDDGTCATDTCDEADFGGVAQACCKAAPPCDFAGAGAAVIHDVNPSSIVTWYGSWVGGGAEIQKIRADSPTPSLVGLRMCARPYARVFDAFTKSYNTIDAVNGTAKFPLGATCTSHRRTLIKYGTSLTLVGWSALQRAIVSGPHNEKNVLFHVRGTLTLRNMELRMAYTAVIVDSRPTFVTRALQLQHPPESWSGVQKGSEWNSDDNSCPSWEEDFAQLVVDSSKFVENDARARVENFLGARSGGGIYAFGGVINFSGLVEFEDNEALKGSGAYFDMGASVHLNGANTRVRFIDNGQALPYGAKAESTLGGAMVIGGESRVSVESGATLEIINNRAVLGGGIYIDTRKNSYPRFESPTRLSVSGAGSSIIVSQNEGCIHGGIGLTRNSVSDSEIIAAGEDPDAVNALMPRPELIVESGGRLDIHGNKADCLDLITEKLAILGTAGGLGNVDGLVRVTGAKSKVRLYDNWSQDMAAGYLNLALEGHLPSELIVSEGATMELRNNTAINAGGGLALKTGNALVTGVGSRITSTGNEAGQFGAGIFMVEEANIRVEKGAQLVVRENKAGLGGAGLFLTDSNITVVSSSSSLLAMAAGSSSSNSNSAEDYALDVSNNSLTSKTAGYGGAGLALGSRSKLRVDARSRFQDNNAGPSDGGGISVFRTSVESGRLGECVDIVLEVLVPKGPKSDDSSFKIAAETRPNSPISFDGVSFVETFGGIRNETLHKVQKVFKGKENWGYWSTHTYCLPCGEYILNTRNLDSEKLYDSRFSVKDPADGTTVVEVEPFMEIRLARDDPGSRSLRRRGRPLVSVARCVRSSRRTRLDCGVYKPWYLRGQTLVVYQYTM